MAFTNVVSSKVDNETLSLLQNVMNQTGASMSEVVRALLLFSVGAEEDRLRRIVEVRRDLSRQIEEGDKALREARRLLAQQDAAYRQARREYIDKRAATLALETVKSLQEARS